MITDGIVVAVDWTIVGFVVGEGAAVGIDRGAQAVAPTNATSTGTIIG